MEVNDVEQFNLNNLSTEHKQRKGRKKKEKYRRQDEEKQRQFEEIEKRKE